ncbi:unnamed protein product [Pseudo-nitzschia multistriata]|uniref:Calcium/calmodulin-dependent protein kinase II association-domain domain-containing protein n=1 Tax=Pseudo-nitzschia multistriata TaxID=183589 RepID=A0A448YVC1_9STRA|nr:unnamed protein product [Pseudo-nitzschia multistriata]
MKFTNSALFAIAAVAATSGVSAFAPATPVVSRMSSADVAAPTSATELNMGLRSFFSRKSKIAKSTAGADITKDEVRALFSLWNNALATGDSRLVASRYATKSGAVLLPTVSDVPRTDFASIKDYFDAFLLKEPQGEILSGDIRIGENWAQDAGIYEFTMGATGDKVKARYSYVYVYENGQWKISHHHSSVMPEGIDIATPIKKEEVQNLFHLWNDALATGDSSLVASRYAKNGVLLPTVSDIPRDNAAKITDYFDSFLLKQPQGEILESFVTIGTNWCQDVGIYEFTLGATGDKVKARYSFVYVYEDGQWKIAHHHSSQMPEAIPAAPAAITKEEVQGLFYKWNSALATLDPDQVAARYSSKTAPCLLPTVSDVPRTDYDSIKAYFVDFCKKKPQGEILESYVTVGHNWAMDDGIYEFTMGATGDKVKARYSFVYTFEDGEWKIAHHHSSQMPEEIVPKASVPELAGSN